MAPSYESPLDVPVIVPVDPPVPKPSDDGRQESQDSYTGNPFYVVIYMRQAKASQAGKVKFQVQAYFYYAPYNQTCGATLRVYRGTDASGQQVFFNTWDWQRDGSSGYHTYFSEWFNIQELDDAQSFSFYAVCSPSIRAQNTYHHFTIIPKNSYTLTATKNEHVETLVYSIQDNSSINGGHRLNFTDPTAVVYEGDTYTWTAVASEGYSLNPASGSGTVTGDVEISPTVTPKATMRIKSADGWNNYVTNIRENGEWVPHQVCIRQDGAWVNYS